MDTSNRSAETQHQDIDADLRYLNELKSKVKGSPICKASNCHGRGYLGIAMVHDKKHGSHPVLQLCHCGSVGETEYSRVMDHLGALELRINGRLEILEKQHNESKEFATLSASVILRNSCWGGIRYVCVLINDAAGRWLQALRQRFQKGGIAIDEEHAYE